MAESWRRRIVRKCSSVIFLLLLLALLCFQTSFSYVGTSHSILPAAGIKGFFFEFTAYRSFQNQILVLLCHWIWRGNASNTLPKLRRTITLFLVGKLPYIFYYLQKILGKRGRRKFQLILIDIKRAIFKNVLEIHTTSHWNIFIFCANVLWEILLGRFAVKILLDLYPYCFFTKMPWGSRVAK